MSNPSQRLDDLLEATGAQLIREKNHRVYRLGNGKTFVTAKTPSDWRGNLNNISDLRRRAGLLRPSQQPLTEPTLAVPKPPQPEPSLAATPLIEEVISITAPYPATPLAQRLDEFIADGEALMIELTDQAAEIERQVAFLKTIRAHADDPMTPALLALIVPQQQHQTPEPVPPPPPPPPPPQITITRKHTEAVIAQIDTDTFTVQDVFERLVNGAITRLAPSEQRRLKNMVAMQLYHLNHNGGNISILKGGRGGTMTIWQKDDPNKIGTRIEISSHDPAVHTSPNEPQETT